MIPLLALPLPLLIAVISGCRAGLRDPQGAGEFWREGAVALAWASVSIFLWHCLWITSILPAPWQDTLVSGAIWTVKTSAVWAPLLVIFYVLYAIKAQRAL
jgi:hypothetical protein